MMTTEEFVKKVLMASFMCGMDGSKRSDAIRSVTNDYVNGLFMDIGTRYTLHPITAPMIYGAFRLYAEEMIEDMDEETKGAAIDFYNDLKHSDHKTLMIKRSAFKKGDKADG